MICIGIDPGLSGALAVLNHNRELLALDDLPTMLRSAGGYVPRQIDGFTLALRLREAITGWQRQEVMVAIEMVGAMPSQGSASVFAFGLAAGAIEGVVAGLRLPHVLVRPQQWKKHLKIPMGKAAKNVDTKELARSAALRLYPDKRLSRKRDHNRAEAVLIARWCNEAYS